MYQGAQNPAIRHTCVMMRGVCDRIVRVLLALSLLAVLIPVALIVFFLVKQGLRPFTWNSLQRIRNII